MAVKWLNFGEYLSGATLLGDGSEMWAVLVHDYSGISAKNAKMNYNRNCVIYRDWAEFDVLINFWGALQNSNRNGGIGGWLVVVF